MIGTLYTTYSQLLIYMIIALAIYQGVRILRRLTWGTILSEANAITIKEVLNNFILIYEPLVLIFFISLIISVSWNQLLPLVVIFLVLSYKHWRNFLSRSVVLIGGQLKTGMHIISNGIEGKLIKLGRLSIDIQTQQGIHKMPYQTLMEYGYTLSEGDKISRLYLIEMKKPNQSSMDPTVHLLDRLANTPYIDWNTTPVIEVEGLDNTNVSLRVVLRDRSHLDELVSLLHEWSYTSITVQN